MPTFPDMKAFANELDRLDRELAKKRRDMGTRMAEAAKPEGYRAAAADLGGDPKFSGWRPWLELQVKGKDWGAAIIPTRYSAGPWTVAEFGRNTMTGPKVRRNKDGSVRTYKRGARKGQVMFQTSRKRWNGITQGKGTATEATSRFERIAEKVGEREFQLVLRRHFDVS